MNSSTKKVGGTVRTLSILKYIASKGSPASLTEVANATKMNTSTCFNILKTLVDTEYLMAFEGSKKYEIGPNLIELTRLILGNLGKLESVRPAMNSIARHFNITITIWRRISRKSMMLLMSAEGDSPLQIRAQIGQKLPLLSYGMGRVMAATSGFDEIELRELFESIKWRDPVAWEEFYQQVSQAKQRGWGLDDGFTNSAVTAISVPVNVTGKEVSVVCSGTMFHGQYPESKYAEIAAALTELADQVATIISQ